MKYVALTQHEQDSMIVSHYVGTESSIHSHRVNVQRYEAMLASGNLVPDRAAQPGELLDWETVAKGGETIRGSRSRILYLLSTEKAALAFDLAIAEATRDQLPAEHVVRAHTAARTAEIAMQSAVPSVRAAAIHASDRVYAETVPLIGQLMSGPKATG